MEVREGYIRTEVGIIPIDWEVNQLSKNVKVQRGGSPRPIEQYLSKNGDGYNWIKIGDTSKGGKYIFSTKEKIIPEGLSKTRQVSSGDLILSNSMSFGRPYILKINGCIHDGWLVLYDFLKAYDKDFLYYILSSECVLRQYLSLASGSGVLNLNKNIVLSIKLPRPPLPEQITISEVLSDTDNLIHSLEKQMAKKMLIKQGVMQNLLSPKDSWIEKKLGDTATLKARIGWQGLTTSEYKTSGDYYLITGTEFKDGFIDWDNCFFVEKARYNQDRYIQIRENDVLVTKDGTIGKVAFIKSIPKPATLNSGVFVIRPIENSFHPEFFNYLLMSEVFEIFLNQLSAGSTINHLYQKDFIHFKFFVPTNIENQKSIAKVLSDIDSEIFVLQRKINKYKLLKVGLLQDLLTGKIRLN